MSALKKVRLDRIVLGHNSFFGVDHLSSQRGADRAAQFENPEKVLELIDYAVSIGAGGLMMSTHERATRIASLIRNHSDHRKNLRMYPLLPYVQKYVTAANEKGMFNVILDTLANSTSSDKLGVLWQGAKGMLQKDLRSILSVLIRVELKMFKDLNISAVFLHDAFTDLALALNLKGIIEFFYSEMDSIYGAEAAFVTKNPGLLLEKFKSWGFEDPIVMAHVNKVGFSMNPSREACEQALEKFPVRVMAMSSLASGFLRPQDAYEYLGGLGSVRSIVVGASSKKHLDETFSAIKEHIRES